MGPTMQATFLFFLNFGWTLGAGRSGGSSFTPKFTNLLENKTAVRGREATFSCHVANLGGYRVGWVKADTKAIQAIHTHVITHNQRVTVSHNGHTLWNLHLDDVHTEDAGAYMCQINTDPMKYQVAYLTVVVPPEIIERDSPTDVLVPEGGSVKLVCRARGYPQPTVKWHRTDGGDIVLRSPNGQRTRYQRIDGEVLHLTKVSRLDMGIYMCTSTNGVAPDAVKRFTVTTHFHPVIHVPNQLVGATAGSELVAECNVEASPRSINYWLRDDTGDLIVTNNRYETIEKHDQLFSVTMTLVIRNFTSFEAGRYRCVAKNSLGEVESTLKFYEIEMEATEKISMDFIEEYYEISDGLDDSTTIRSTPSSRLEEIEKSINSFIRSSSLRKTISPIVICYLVFKMSFFLF
ncbi:lachesin-like [Artemia franciscana]|uniref:Ig-like domain-containing protein n=1 Tax=Artemia franciscana TaxID=6661 RepID=A0AA88L5C8_ARTSF|nr:hypothetical protein QYM36_009393 [Artemia franciscana]